MHRSQSEWIKEFQSRGAYWRHGGDPAMPHALLTAGGHSDGFFNSSVLAQDPILLEQVAEDLVELMMQAEHGITAPTCVVGPAMGAITLAHDIARVIGKKRGFSCRTVYAEKGPATQDGSKTMVFTRGEVGPEDIVLLVEDVWTTGSSLWAVERLAYSKGAKVLCYRVLIVNRSGEEKAQGAHLISLINEKMTVWEAEKCPLCRQGSQALRPKGNWDLLTGKVPVTA